MKGKKQFRFAAIREFENVLECPENMQGQWAAFFGNNNPIVLELACGKGEYTRNMAKAFPDKNFLGIDIKGNRIFVGAKEALGQGIKNVGFMRAQIQQLEDYFKYEEFQEIWITFPDPFLRDSKAKNRLTHSRFLKVYQALLPPNALIHLKTDSKPLFDFTQEMLELHKCVIHEKIDDIYAKGEPVFPLNIKTFYEKMHLEDKRTIQYISFSLPTEEIIVPPKKKKGENE
jgi:tRNA (guanine-N7-)-methyltransferase